MVTIKRYFNVKTVKIRADVIENIVMLQSDGSFHYVSYIDTIEYQKVKFLNTPAKVLLESHGYKMTDSINEPWRDLREDQYLDGVIYLRRDSDKPSEIFDNFQPEIWGVVTASVSQFSRV